jgi:L-serine/L-threonine ammonia-lyase
VAVARVSRFNSRASGSLGVSIPAPHVVKLALERKGAVRCVTVPDEMSMQTLLRVAGMRCVSSHDYISDGTYPEDHKFLVELACSTTLTPAYNQAFFSSLLAPTKPRVVVFIVCGGFKISLEEMLEYQALLDDDMRHGAAWEVFCDGERWQVNK